MKKSAYIILTAVLLCIFSLTALGSEDFISDYTDKIPERSEEILREKAKQINEKYDFKALLILTDKGIDVLDLARKQYTEKFGEKDGLAFVYNTDNDKYGFYLSGKAKQLYPENEDLESLYQVLFGCETFYFGFYDLLDAIDKEIAKSLYPCEASVTTADTKDTAAKNGIILSLTITAASCLGIILILIGKYRRKMASVKMR